MDADAKAHANADDADDADTTADSGGNTIALRERCSGELITVFQLYQYDRRKEHNRNFIQFLHVFYMICFDRLLVTIKKLSF